MTQVCPSGPETGKTKFVPLFCLIHSAGSRAHSNLTLENNIANLIANFVSSLLGANNCVSHVIIKFLLALMLKDYVYFNNFISLSNENARWHGYLHVNSPYDTIIEVIGITLKIWMRCIGKLSINYCSFFSPASLMSFHFFLHSNFDL